MAKKNTLDMTRGPIVKKLFAFAMPLILSLILQQLYNLADRAVVGRFAADGKNALAAIGATGSITSLLLNLSNGLASGLNVRCANLRGAGDEKTLRKSMHTGVLLAAALGLFLGAVGILISKPMLLLLDTPKAILPKSTLYLQIYFAGLPATVVYNFGAAILRSHGDTKRPMYILMFSGILNVVLNLILVIVFKMDVAGVAIATAVAQALSAVRILGILFNKKDAYKLTFKELGFHLPSLRVIISIGVPNGLNGVLFSLSNLVVQSSINSFNDTAIIAAKTAAMDAGNLVYQIIHGFSLACVSSSGQCYGAKKYKRIDQLAIKAILCSGALVAAAAGLMTLFPDIVIGIFNDSPDVIAVGKNILLINSWSYVIYVVSDIYLSCTRGMGRSMGITLMNIAAIIAPRLIWIWFFFPSCRTIEFLYLCYPFSYVTSAIAQFIYFKMVRRKVDKQALAEAQ
ncbi:MAG: MATE family efflux transporter [Oscillospiraceae bacterium]|nr:MATE family efflux transporter [Oscillospiraceae bacterium]